MTDWPLALGAALLPMLYVTRVSQASLRRCWEGWLWGLWVVAAATLIPLEPWLAVMGFAGAYWWRTRGEWPIGWAGIGATWFLARTLPAGAWDALPWAWGAWAMAGAGAMGWQAWRQDRRKVRGWWGMRSIAAALLALLLPVLPLPCWPVVLGGLWLSGPSILAVAAAFSGAIVRWPGLWPLWATLAALGGALALVVALGPSVKGRRIGEWTPRGDSLDSVWHRLALLRWAVPRATLAGLGPGSLLGWHNRAYIRGQLGEATGTMHNEPVQVVLEYGAPGALALGLFAWRVGSGLQGGDPWSAMVVAGAVVAGGTMALRVAPIGVLWLLACAKIAP